jgi:uncharacterized protein YcfL
VRRLLIFPLVLTLLACVSCSSAMESTSAPPMARADEEAPMEESAYAAVDMVVGQMPGQE